MVLAVVCRRCLLLGAPPNRTTLRNIGLRFGFKIRSHLTPIHRLAVLEQPA